MAEPAASGLRAASLPLLECDLTDYAGPLPQTFQRLPMAAGRSPTPPRLTPLLPTLAAPSPSLPRTLCSNSEFRTAASFRPSYTVLALSVVPGPLQSVARAQVLAQLA